MLLPGHLKTQEGNIPPCRDWLDECRLAGPVRCRLPADSERNPQGRWENVRKTLDLDDRLPYSVMGQMTRQVLPAANTPSMRRGGLSIAKSSVSPCFLSTQGVFSLATCNLMVTAPPWPALSRRWPFTLRWLPRQEGSSFSSGSRTLPQVRPDDGLAACRPILRESGLSPNGAHETRHADPPDVREPLLSLW
jgi:hypothetical protein